MGCDCAAAHEQKPKRPIAIFVMRQVGSGAKLIFKRLLRHPGGFGQAVLTVRHEVVRCPRSYWSKTTR